MLNPMNLMNDLIDLANTLAPQQGYNSTLLENVRILRSEAVLEDVPVLYRPGAVFVLSGSKQGIWNGKVIRYDASHYLAVSVPVPFRMSSQASPESPILAIYLDFDLHLAAEVLTGLSQDRLSSRPAPAQSMISSPMSDNIRDVLRRLLVALANPEEARILGPGLLRELHYRVLTGPQGAELSAALSQSGSTERLLRTLETIKKNYSDGLRVADLAGIAGMSIASYHVAFKDMTGTTPTQYIKTWRLNEARLMIARGTGTIASIAGAVGYASPAQFSRDFKRQFGRNARDEVRWMREHLGEIAQPQFNVDRQDATRGNR